MHGFILYIIVKPLLHGYSLKRIPQKDNFSFTGEIDTHKNSYRKNSFKLIKILPKPDTYIRWTVFFASMMPV